MTNKGIVRILAIETSCDETGAAVVEGVSPTLPIKVLVNTVASSENMHVKTGGIVPEVASREQLKSIIPVIQESIKASKLKSVKEIDAIAVTVGPGLVGSLLVGVETAKALSFAWEKPIIPVNHLIAHLYANFVSTRSNEQETMRNDDKVPELPAIGLVVSGGHTDLVLMKDHNDIKFLGGTRDDAAGECLDKCARLLGLPYPGGPAIAAEAAKWRIENEEWRMKLPRPLMHEDTYDFSFSGLKTAVAREVNKFRIGGGITEDTEINRKHRNMLAFELQEAVVDVLVNKLERVVKEFKPKSVLLGGGVAANSRLRESLNVKCKMLKANLFVPPKELCTDNAVMIGAAGYYYHSPVPWKKVQVDPGLEIG